MTSTSATPADIYPRPSQDALHARFVGVPLSELPTPSLLIDRARLEYNCGRMMDTVAGLQCRFRAHIKTLKTSQTTLYQLGETKQRAIIVSTLAEAWGVVRDGLVKDGKVKDILYGLPVGPHKVKEFLLLRQQVQSQSNNEADVKVLIDNVDQVAALHSVLAQQPDSAPLSVYIKIDCGAVRAGLSTISPALPPLIKALASASPQLRIHGVYSYSHFSYFSKSPEEASKYLAVELKAVNEAAALVKKVCGAEHAAALPASLVLSVGSTPTAHVAHSLRQAVAAGEIDGELELHAGNYTVLDLQQLATNAYPDPTRAAIERCALSVLATVVSSYPLRGARDGVVQLAHADGRAHTGDEALCDAGGIAFSKDTGPLAGFGHVIWPKAYIGWQLGRVSQEHGVLTVRQGSADEWLTQWGFGGELKERRQAELRALDQARAPVAPHIGDKVSIVPQHACMTAAAHPWYLIYDSSMNEDVPTIQDVWVPFKGW